MSQASVIAAVIPCYRETRSILDVIARIGDEISHIVIVDDACPDGTGTFVRDNCDDDRVEIVVHEQNAGVGAATLTGYTRALESGADVIVKLDGDGQMAPELIPMIAAPVALGRADYSKGNRFHSLEDVKRMPAVRIAGNLALSFLTKLSGGYWNIFDPTNGFTAIRASVARQLPFDKIAKRYFFESDILFRLNTQRARVADVPMTARYADEESQLRISRALWEFPLRHAINTLKRIGYSYFIRDFNIASIELVLGHVFIAFGSGYGAFRWWESNSTGVPATAGTVVLAALPIILGFQMLLAFLEFDIRNVPTEPVHPGLEDAARIRST